MESYAYLVSIAIIMLTTKILGDLTKRVNMPQVVGALLAGVIIGPTCLGLIAETEFISYTAEIGVILLMFLAGLDTDIEEIKKKIISCIVIACIFLAVKFVGVSDCYYYLF